MNIVNEIDFLNNLIEKAKNLQIQFSDDMSIEFMISQYQKRIKDIQKRIKDIQKTKTLLWLDDERNPNTEKWTEYLKNIVHLNLYDVIWVKSYTEFVQFIENSMPDMIFFDNDLGEVTYTDNGETINGMEGYDCAKYLSEYCIQNSIPLPDFNVQSANPVAKQNIISYLNNHKKFYE